MIDMLRKKFPVRFAESFDAVDLTSSQILDLMEMEEDMAKSNSELKRCMKELTDDQRGVIRARLTGKTPVEIANSMELDRSRVDRLFSDALQKLKKCVRPNS